MRISMTSALDALQDIEREVIGLARLSTLLGDHLDRTMNFDEHTEVPEAQPGHYSTVCCMSRTDFEVLHWLSDELIRRADALKQDIADALEIPGAGHLASATIKIKINTRSIANQ